MEKIKSGIPGLDELLGGGFPKGSSILLGGGAGTGKTIMGMQYLYNGATEFDEPGLFVTLESNVKNITWNMESFNWDIRKLQNEQKLSIYRLNLGYTADKKLIEGKINDELKVISSMVKEIKAKRLVIDSTTAFGMWLNNEMLRSMLFKFADSLKELNCTTLLTSETKGGKVDFSAYGVEEFVVDGVLALYFYPPHRSIFVRKMRGTNHDKNVHPFEISAKGIDIKHKETVMWEALK